MKLQTLLELGRISNLPTVWSNVLCGAVLAGGELRTGPLLVAATAGTLFYLGGMFLNDAFDAEIDARERPNRPIPSGRAARRVVFGIGFGLLALGLLLLAFAGSFIRVGSAAGLLAAGAFVAAFVLLYDWRHKQAALSPLLMGLCRAGLYFMGGFAASERLSPAVTLGGAALALYIVGLTHIARFETASRVGRLWPAAFVATPLLLAVAYGAASSRAAGSYFAWSTAVVAGGWAVFSVRLALRGGPAIGRAVVSLIAGIALVDAALMAAAGSNVSAAFALGAFALTLFGQRFVSGT